jgi:DNA polymerase-4
VSGSFGLYGDAARLARRLKQRVCEETELNVSVGVAPNKLVAKIACTLGKPDGLRVVEQNDIRALLDPLPVRRLWGVGPVLGAKLEALGIRSFADLSGHAPRALREALGDRARELQALARGEDDREVEADREPKSYGEENTFESDVLDRDRVTAALTAHAEAVARRVRNDGYAGRTVTLKAKLGRARGRRDSRDLAGGSEPSYPLVTRSKTLELATDDGALIRAVAVALWDAAGVREPVRLLGVSLSSLERAQAVQLDLFAHRQTALGKTLDAISERFGDGAIGRAVERPHKITHGRTKKRGER